MKPSARLASRLFIAILTILLIVQPVMAKPSAAPGDAVGPTIIVWDGPTQSFGAAGWAQAQVNVLGNVSDPDGIKSLTYTLNGGAEQTLSRGPDTRRLYETGDFNVEMYYDDLNLGANTVVIKATDMLDQVSTATVTVNIASGSSPIPHSIDWSTVTNINSVAQITDGRWSVSASGVRTTQIGYDRMVAVGELDWTNYEVTVPVTVHSLDPNGYEYPSNSPMVGLILGWTEFSDSPGYVSGMQPKEGWLPYGAIPSYRWVPGEEGLKLYTNENLSAVDTSGWTLELGTTYIFKVRMESVQGAGPFYRFKVWAQGQLEPAAWNLSAQGSPNDPQTGSILLQAHHVDVTFGNVSVNTFTDTDLPVISDVLPTPGINTATITWKTNEPATSRVDFGATTAYGSFVEDATPVINHVVKLTGLTPNTPYHFKLTSEDQYNHPVSSLDNTFTTKLAGGASNIQSDDFNACTLNTAIWKPYKISPEGDTSLALVGTYTADARLSFAVPTGTDHDLGENDNRAPRIMQIADDTDFELEAKFDSQVSSRFQMQGILVEQEVDKNYLRFEFYGDGESMHVSAFKYESGAQSRAADDVLIPVSQGSPQYMRVKRAGDQWTLSYSNDGIDWILSHNFIHALQVTSVGAYGANADPQNGGAPPAHTALVDYFFNIAAPVAAEDAVRNSLTIQKVGTGDVVLSPAKTSYGCNETVTLDANPAPGYKFVGWSGDIAGIANKDSEVVTVNMNGSRTITATFTAVEPGHYTLSVNTVGQGTVAKDPNTAEYLEGSQVTLTATPKPGWKFAGWSGVGYNSTDNPLKVTMTKHMVLTATFTQTVRIFIPSVMSGR